VTLSLADARIAQGFNGKPRDEVKKHSGSGTIMIVSPPEDGRWYEIPIEVVFDEYGGGGGTSISNAGASVVCGDDGSVFATAATSTNLIAEDGGVGISASDTVMIGAGTTFQINDPTNYIYTDGSGMHMDGTAIKFGVSQMGFFNTAPASRPTVPMTPTAQDVVDALVTLGLVVQA